VREKPMGDKEVREMKIEEARKKKLMGDEEARGRECRR
jgi:hypothetical protein